MRRIAIYGKGGIGKSTTSANISAALSLDGYRVMQIGCDPKADSTSLLRHGNPPITILDARRNGRVELEDVVKQGFAGVLCVECGGPKPGVGCAGRGIINAFETLDSLDAFKIYKPDVIIYDVLGDVVCGGFAMPIRNGYAREVYVVSSGEKMSVYAANNIAQAIENFKDSGYAHLCGIIQNSRGIENENEILDSLAENLKCKIISRLPRDPVVQECEDLDMTVMEHRPFSTLADKYRKLSNSILSNLEV